MRGCSRSFLGARIERVERVGRQRRCRRTHTRGSPVWGWGSWLHWYENGLEFDLVRNRPATALVEANVSKQAEDFVHLCKRPTSTAVGKGPVQRLLNAPGCYAKLARGSSEKVRSLKMRDVFF
jgi:hypothetical protein